MRDSIWQTRAAGQICFRYELGSEASQDLDVLSHRYGEALAAVATSLELDPTTLPTITIVLTDRPRADDAESDLRPDALSGQDGPIIWSCSTAEAPRGAPEVELAHVLLELRYGRPPAGARFWDQGLAGHLARTGKRPGPHAEAVPRCRQLITDCALPPVAELIAETRDRASVLAELAASAFADFLIERHGLERYRRLLEAVRADEAGAFEQVYGCPLAVAERDWRRTAESALRGGGQSTWATLRQILPIARPYWKAGLAVIGFSLLIIAFSLSLPLAFRFLVDDVLGRQPLHEPVPLVGPAGHVITPGQEQLDTLLKLMSLLGLLYLVNTAAKLGLNRLVNRASQALVFDLRRELLERLARLPTAYFAHSRTADIQQRVIADTNAVQLAVQRGLVLLTTGGLAIVLFGALLFVLQPKLALVAALGLPLLGLVYHLRRRARRAAAREQARRLADLVELVCELIDAQVLVKVYAAAPYLLRRLYGRMEAHRVLNVAFTDESSLLGQAGSLILNLIQMAVLLAGGFMVVLSGGRELGPGGLVAFYLVLNQIIGPLTQIATASQTLVGASASVERVAALLAEQPELESSRAVEVGPLREAIRFEEVSFAYSDERPVLREISLTIPAGAMVGLVGPTGAGKSSIAQLLPRLYDPTGGRVTWDGLDLRDARLASLRRQVMLVPQESPLLASTVFENIRFGLADASDRQVEQAARLAQAHDFIVDLSDGYDTILGPQGVGLSGGQRQRIALARAILRQPSVMILDEATSALDASTQRAVLEGLRDGRGGWTVITIAHRLEAVAEADVVFVFEDGRVVEQGRHSELLAAGGTFARLFEDQVGSFQTGRLSPRRAGRAVARLRAFAAWPEELQAALATMLQPIEQRAGDLIYARGAESDALYVVGSGRVEVLADDGTDRPRVVNVLRAGEVFGDAAFLAGRPRPISTRAATDVLLYRLDRAALAATQPRTAATADGRAASAIALKRPN